MSWFERDWGISADSNVVLFKKNTHIHTQKILHQLADSHRRIVSPKITQKGLSYSVRDTCENPESWRSCNSHCCGSSGGTHRPSGDLRNWGKEQTSALERERGWSNASVHEDELFHASLKTTPGEPESIYWQRLSGHLFIYKQSLHVGGPQKLWHPKAVTPAQPSTSLTARVRLYWLLQQLLRGKRGQKEQREERKIVSAGALSRPSRLMDLTELKRS